MMRADPGIGRESAPIGSEAWAQRVRLHIQSTVLDLPKAPSRFLAYYKAILEHRAWTLMNRPDGAYFDKWEEFCSHPQPWGLGMAWSEIRPFLATVVSERELDLATVAPAKVPDPPTPGPGRGKKKLSDASSDTFSHSPAEQRKAETLRAINRAPEPARDLYKAGLLGQKEAAKLGPRNATPEQAARVTEIARELAADAETADLSSERSRRDAKKALTAKTRDLLGVRRDKVVEAMKAIERLSIDERERLIEGMRERKWL